MLSRFRDIPVIIEKVVELNAGPVETIYLVDDSGASLVDDVGNEWVAE